ncbi:MAG: heme-binding protein [Acholeplasmatales bacterium]|nr:MAG: heme-binding protein [Acholeplasmatales bacterium]
MARYESPTYAIIRQDGPFELRRYETFATSAVDTKDFSGRDGFGTLFSYIGGKNQPAIKMSMTVPVINTMKEDGLSMEFVVPKTHLEQGVPEPLDARIRLQDYHEHLAAVVRFSGSVRPERIEAALEQLKQWLVRQKLTAVGPVRIARYNSPFSLPMLRRNELWVEVVLQED